MEGLPSNILTVKYSSSQVMMPLWICFFRNCDAMKKFSDMGAATKETPSEVAEASDVVITMLPASSHVSFIIHTILLQTLSQSFVNCNSVPQKNHLDISSVVPQRFKHMRKIR